MGPTFNTPLTMEGRYLAFSLDGVRYGISIARVHRIIRKVKPCSIIDASDFVVGMVDALGLKIPVVNLRLKLGLEPTKETWETCFIVIRYQVDNEFLPVALGVDKVLEVMELDHRRFADVLPNDLNIDPDLIVGLERKTLIMNASVIFSKQELVLLSKMAKRHQSSKSLL